MLQLQVSVFESTCLHRDIIGPHLHITAAVGAEQLPDWSAELAGPGSSADVSWVAQPPEAVAARPAAFEPGMVQVRLLGGIGCGAEVMVI